MKTKTSVSTVTTITANNTSYTIKRVSSDLCRPDGRRVNISDTYYASGDGFYVGLSACPLETAAMVAEIIG